MDSVYLLLGGIRQPVETDVGLYCEPRVSRITLMTSSGLSELAFR